MGIWQWLVGEKQDAPAPAQNSTTTAQESDTNTDEKSTVTTTEENAEMLHEDLITTDSLSPKLLKSVFDAAFMEATMDDDDGGEIVVQEEVKVRVKVNPDNSDKIRFLTTFVFKSDSAPLARLQCANLINAEYIMVCASAEEDLLFFRYDLLVAGGVTKKALVMAIKRFASIPQQAVGEHGSEIVK